MTAPGAARREWKAERNREAAAKKAAERRRAIAFGAIVVAVLLVGGYLAFGDFLNPRGTTTVTGAIPVQSSMAGFTPNEIRVKAGEPVVFDWWTDDSALHLEGGVHTLVSAALGLDEKLPAAGASGQSRRLVSFTAPSTPGTYDIVCETCCGGSENPAMHGKVVVEV
jgi:plastocyanin